MSDTKQESIWRNRTQRRSDDPSMNVLLTWGT